MPVYEYKCSNCGAILEIFDNHIKTENILFYTCKKCKIKTEHKQIISKSAFILKGAGWAKDNYHKNNN